MARTALPTYNDRDASLALVFWGGTTATGTMLGQVQSFNWTSEKETRDTYRVGDSSRHRVYSAINCDWTMTLYEDDDASEIFLAWGGDAKPTAGGWLGTEDVTLTTTDASTTVTIANYDGEATSSTLLWTETLATTYVESVERNLEANSENLWNFAGSAATIIGEPVADMGVGA